MHKKLLSILLFTALMTPHFTLAMEQNEDKHSGSLFQAAYAYMPSRETVKKVAVCVLVVSVVISPVLAMPLGFAFANARQVPQDEERFQSEVATFARAHGEDFEHVLKSKDLSEELLKNPEIECFLARAEPPAFVKQQIIIEGLNYTKQQTNPEFGAIERSIYAALCNHGITLPFRSSKPQVESCSGESCYLTSTSCEYAPDFFYDSGTESDIYAWLLKKMLSKTALPKGITVTRGRDIYQMGTFAKEALKDSTRQTFEDSGLEFILFPGGKDNHAFTVLSVVDQKNKKTLGHFLFNTWQKTEYFEYLDDRIDMFTTREGNYQKPPFLDASLHVQISPDDSNCALYSLIFTQRLLDLFARNRDFIENLAAVFKAPEANRTPLIAKIRNTLESQLPFFECNEDACTRKSDAEIRGFFLNYRWMVGSEYLKEVLLPSLRTGR